MLSKIKAVFLAVNVVVVYAAILGMGVALAFTAPKYGYVAALFALVVLVDVIFLSKDTFKSAIATFKKINGK
jgi:hypothetical protein